ncbi:MAG TPA: hypothetical protein VGI74_10095 [Streptosporangiaceae bacterium]
MDATVLLVMDVQRGVAGRFASGTEYLPRLARAVAAARADGIPVVYVTAGAGRWNP